MTFEGFYKNMIITKHHRTTWYIVRPLIRFSKYSNLPPRGINPVYDPYQFRRIMEIKGG